MQTQIAECLRSTEARDPAIFVTREEEASALLREVALEDRGRSLPLLDSGSLSLRSGELRNDELTTPLAQSALSHSLPPGPNAESSSMGRSRSITFAEETEAGGSRTGRVSLLVAFGALALLGV